jgi:16S rRNA (cytosine967-C5)-methyltransferase
MSSAGAQLRVSAALALQQVWQGRSLKAVLGHAREAFADSRDRALLEAICYGAIRHRRELEFALKHFLSQSLERQDLIGHCLLLVGLTQLHILKLSPHAAVSATVDAARLLERGNRAGLINAVLRRSQREGLPESDALGVRENHPDWLLGRLQADWPADWPSIVAANNTQAPLWLRVAEKINPAEALAHLQAAGINAAAAAQRPEALRVDAGLSPEKLPGWAQGHWAVQDLSAQSAVPLLAVADGAQVWDMCAAPGGKSAQLLEAKPGLVLLTDSEAERLEKIQQLLERLELNTDAACLQALDASAALPDNLPQRFDAILLDAPCSATGIIRRQPDVKWHRREKDIGVLGNLQWRLLKNAWQHLKPGGKLLYCTCSVLKAENETLMAHFMTQHPDARALPLPAHLGRLSGIGRQRLPGEDGGDGFYYALLQKA